MTLPAYRKYRNSGVEWLGEIPSHWDVTPLKRVASVQTGIAKGKDMAGKQTITVPYLRVANVQDGYLSLDDVAMIEIEPEQLARYRLRAGDVLMNEGGDFDKLGRGAIWSGAIADCIHQNHVFAVRPHGFDSHWLTQVTASRYAQFYFMGRAKQSTNLASISSSNIMELPVVVPPAAERDGILAFLDREIGKIDALLAEQRKLIALLAEKRQSTISHAVTRGLRPDVPMKQSSLVWTDEVPMHWSVKRLKTISPEITVGIVVEPSKYYVDDGVAALRSLNVSPGKLSAENLVHISEESNQLLGKSRLREGDLVCVRTGQPGTAAVVSREFDGCNCIDLIIIRRPLEHSERFLCWYFASDAALRQFSSGSGGAIQQHFNVSAAMNLQVVLPPPAEQLAIADFLDDESAKLGRLKAEAARAIHLLKERRSALITAAVTGQIDVRGAIRAPESISANLVASD